MTATHATIGVTAFHAATRPWLIVGAPATALLVPTFICRCLVSPSALPAPRLQVSDMGVAFPVTVKFEACQSPLITDLTVDIPGGAAKVRREGRESERGRGRRSACRAEGGSSWAFKPHAPSQPLPTLRLCPVRVQTWKVSTSSFFNTGIPVTVGSLGAGAIFAVVESEQVSGKTYTWAAGEVPPPPPQPPPPPAATAAHGAVVVARLRQGETTRALDRS